MFNHGEAQALVAAVRIAKPRLDTDFALQLEAALSKIMAVLPSAARAAADSVTMYAPPVALDSATRDRLETLRVATEMRHKLFVHYLDLKNSRSERTLRPLGCFYWGEVWTLAAWCESRAGFRSFRVDRLQGVEVLPERFRDEAGKTLPDLLRAVKAVF
jgi:predicted DNA-binding transcriptional regulator YafY